MSGCFEERSNARVVEEQWMVPRAGMMLGMGRTTVGDTVREFEHLRISEGSGGLEYTASPSGQATAVFRSAIVSDTLVRFENPQHDFPQSIQYHRTGSSTLEATVEGKIRGNLRVIRFKYVRVRCSGDALRIAQPNVLHLGRQMAHLTRSAVYLPVHDVEATIEFYRRALDFETEYVAGQPAQFAIVSRSGLPIMLRRVGEDTALQPHRGSEGAWDVFFWTDDARSLCEEYEKKAIPILYGPVQQPYDILEFAIADCNGYVIGFGEAV